MPNLKELAQAAMNEVEEKKPSMEELAQAAVEKHEKLIEEKFANKAEETVDMPKIKHGNNIEFAKSLKETLRGTLWSRTSHKLCC